jgi:hypothetical protein
MGSASAPAARGAAVSALAFATAVALPPTTADAAALALATTLATTLATAFAFATARIRHLSVPSARKVFRELILACEADRAAMAVEAVGAKFLRSFHLGVAPTAEMLGQEVLRVAGDVA